MSNLKKPEILAPAGSLEILYTAISAGADAVYCSGKQFGARRFAPNFTNEELIIASKYVHLRKKKLYVTVNTIVFENELATLREYVDFLYQYVDGVIVQDLGVMHYLRKTYPDFPVHLSTQCNVHNVKNAQFFQSLGISRIVLARETPLEVVNEIAKLNIDVEIFVHGALCFSYSGNCYMSYAIGGRSGNRGSCAQPCRKRYSLYEDNKCILEDSSLLSMKDLMTLEDVDKLCDLGVTSFKIEGRMKQKEYVVSVVKAYREAVDSWYNKQQFNLKAEVLDSLKATFNRQFTKGYLLNALNNEVTNQLTVNHQGLYIGDVITTSKTQVIIKLHKPLILHDAIRLIDRENECGFIVTRIIKDGKMVKESNAGDVVTIDVPLSLERNAKVYKTQDALISKEAEYFQNHEQVFNEISGSLIVDFNKISFEIRDFEDRVQTIYDVKLDVANKEIDFERIKDQMRKLAKLPFVFNNISVTFNDKAFVPIPLLNQIRTETLQKWQETLENKKRRQVIPYEYQNSNLHNSKAKINIKILDHSKEQLAKRIEFTPTVNNQSDLIEQLWMIKKDCAISPYLNVTNHYAIEFLRNFTCGPIYLSLELDTAQLEQLSSYDGNLGIVVYTTFPLMISRHCVVPTAYKLEHKNCGLCQKHKYHLLDTYGNMLPLYFEDCNMFILSSKSYNQLQDPFIEGINNYLLEFYSETEIEKIEIIEKIKKRLDL